MAETRHAPRRIHRRTARHLRRRTAAHQGAAETRQGRHLAAAARGIRVTSRRDAGTDRAPRTGVREPRREGPRQALRRHRGHHRRGQVHHGRGLRRDDDGRLPDCRRAARGALRDGGVRNAGRVGEGHGAHGGGGLCSRRRSTRRKRPTRSCRRSPRAASTRVPRTRPILTKTRRKRSRQPSAPARRRPRRRRPSPVVAGSTEASAAVLRGRRCRDPSRGAAAFSPSTLPSRTSDSPNIDD